jgi:hypothetical protein
VVVGEDRVAAWAARLDQAQIAAQIRQTSHARAQGTFAGTRALIEGLAAARASQATRWALFWMASVGTLLVGVAVAVLLWIGKRRARVTAYTREVNRLYDPRALPHGHSRARAHTCRPSNRLLDGPPGAFPCPRGCPEWARESPSTAPGIPARLRCSDATRGCPTPDAGGSSFFPRPATRRRPTLTARRWRARSHPHRYARRRDSPASS